MKKLSKKARLRLTVIRDAIKQIKAGYLLPHQGTIIGDEIETVLPYTFADGYGKIEKVFDVVELQGPVRKFFKDKKKKCKVCARGALFLTTVAKDNKCRGNLTRMIHAAGAFRTEEKWGYEGPTIDSRLLKLFGNNQIAMIECAFEEGMNQEHLSDSDYYNSTVFGKRYKSDKKRLLSILENMLKNGGFFTPPDNWSSAPDSYKSFIIRDVYDEINQ